MPVILAAGFFRLRYESRAEEANQEVFRESAGFATESIGAMRTVTALGLEGSIVSFCVFLLLPFFSQFLLAPCSNLL